MAGQNTVNVSRGLKPRCRFDSCRPRNSLLAQRQSVTLLKWGSGYRNSEREQQPEHSRKSNAMISLGALGAGSMSALWAYLHGGHSSIG